MRYNISAVHVACSTARRPPPADREISAPAHWRIIPSRSSRARRTAIAAVVFGGPRDERLRRAVFVLESAASYGVSSELVLIVPSGEWREAAVKLFPVTTDRPRLTMYVADADAVTAPSMCDTARRGSAWEWMRELNIVCASFLLRSYDAVAYVESDMLITDSMSDDVNAFAASDGHDFEAAPDEMLSRTDAMYFNAGAFHARPSRAAFAYLMRFRDRDVEDGIASAMCRFGVQDLLNEALPRFYGAQRILWRAARGFNCQHNCASEARLLPKPLRVVHFTGHEKPRLEAGAFAAPTCAFTAHVVEYQRRYASWIANRLLGNVTNAS
jgi:hypothetical protein